MKYDDAKWHVGGQFPTDLSYDHACTHIAFFLGWVVLRGLESDLFHTRYLTPLSLFREKRIDPLTLLHQIFDDRLIDDFLCEECNLFANSYYLSDKYFGDYVDLLASTAPSPYHVEITWDNLHRVAAMLDQRFDEWRNMRAVGLRSR